jgi:hypothetical protein
VAEAAEPAELIAAAGGVERRAAGPVGAAPRAVPIAAIAAAAEEEDVVALGAGADHESERVHRSSRARRTGMDTREEMCKLWSLGQAESRSSRFGLRVRGGRALRALTLSASWWERSYPTAAGSGNRPCLLRRSLSGIPRSPVIGDTGVELRAPDPDGLPASGEAVAG